MHCIQSQVNALIMMVNIHSDCKNVPCLKQLSTKQTFELWRGWRGRRWPITGVQPKPCQVFTANSSSAAGDAWRTWSAETAQSGLKTGKSISGTKIREQTRAASVPMPSLSWGIIGSHPWNALGRFTCHPEPREKRIRNQRKHPNEEKDKKMRGMQRREAQTEGLPSWERLLSASCTDDDDFSTLSPGLYSKYLVDRFWLMTWSILDRIHN